MSAAVRFPPRIKWQTSSTTESTSAPELTPAHGMSSAGANRGICAHPEWTLEHLSTVLDEAGKRTGVLRKLTIGELLAGGQPKNTGCGPAPDGGPPVDHARLERAQRSSADDFDELVRDVVTEADGRSVSASYLRARVGGPRWKLQASLRRLATAGEVEQRGRTSATRYRILRGATSA